MEELEKELRNVNENLRKYRMDEITEERMQEIKEDLDNKIKSTLANTDITIEEEIKKFKFAIKNHLNSIYEIREHISKDKILELREIISEEYLK